MRHRYQRIIFLLADGALAVLAQYVATFLRFDGHIAQEFLDNFPLLMAIAAGSVILGGLLFGTYNSLWSYMGFNEVFLQFAAVVFSGVVFLVVKLTEVIRVSGSITLIYVGILFLCTTAIRGIPRVSRWLHARREIKAGDRLPTVVVGAGNAGAMIIRRLRDDPLEGFYPIAAVDDDAEKLGRTIAGVPVAGTISQVERVCDRYQAKQIVIAIPSANEAQINGIHDKCRKAKLPIKLFRSVVDIESYLSGDARALKDVSIEDLLFRDSVKPDMGPVYAFLKDKRVLVTGGAGSIGSEICRQVLEHGCGHLVVFDIHENGLFELNEELRQTYDPARYTLCLGSVRDPERLRAVMDRHRPQIVLHAAAHKHVPMMELNPMEAVKNNVMGTHNVLTCCADHGVSRFILISTDKAVNPTNIMGATKRVAELLVQSMNGMGGCEMAAVRFGNVLGSNGSVIPTFKRQIAMGGPVTVTDKEMKRYFMTIPEAVSLVLTAGTLAKGGEVFVLDMGKPIKIYDLACNLIKLSGLQPEKDIAIKIIGLRPGEKLFEEIALDSESVDKTSQKSIFVLRTSGDGLAFPWQDFSRKIEGALKQDDEAGVTAITFAAIGTQGSADAITAHVS